MVYWDPRSATKGCFFFKNQIVYLLIYHPKPQNTLARLTINSRFWKANGWQWISRQGQPLKSRDAKKLNRSQYSNLFRNLITKNDTPIHFVFVKSLGCQTSCVKVWRNPEGDFLDINSLKNSMKFQLTLIYPSHSCSILNLAVEVDSWKKVVHIT